MKEKFSVMPRSCEYPKIIKINGPDDIKIYLDNDDVAHDMEIVAHSISQILNECWTRHPFTVGFYDRLNCLPRNSRTDGEWLAGWDCANSQSDEPLEEKTVDQIVVHNPITLNDLNDMVNYCRTAFDLLPLNQRMKACVQYLYEKCGRQLDVATLRIFLKLVKLDIVKANQQAENQATENAYNYAAILFGLQGADAKWFEV